MSNRSPVIDDKLQKTQASAEENWNHQEEKYKEKLEVRDKILQYVVEHLEEKLAAAKDARGGTAEIENLEKERDSWKKKEEEVQKMNADLAQQRNSLLDQNADLMAELKLATDQRDAYKLLADEREFQLSKKEEEMKNLAEMWQEKLEKEAEKNRKLLDRLYSAENQLDYVSHLLDCEKYAKEQLIEESNDLIDEAGAMREKLSAKDEEIKEMTIRLESLHTIYDCSICMDNKIQMIFRCGHGCCDDCFTQLQECPICRQHIDRRNAIKMYIS